MKERLCQINPFRLWHRPLNPRKLMEVNHPALRQSTNLQRALKFNRLPEVSLCRHLETEFTAACCYCSTSRKHYSCFHSPRLNYFQGDKSARSAPYDQRWYPGDTFTTPDKLLQVSPQPHLIRARCRASVAAEGECDRHLCGRGLTSLYLYFKLYRRREKKVFRWGSFLGGI